MGWPRIWPMVLLGSVDTRSEVMQRRRLLSYVHRYIDGSRAVFFYGLMVYSGPFNFTIVKIKRRPTNI